MRLQTRRSRLGRFGPLGFVVVLAGLSAACSDSLRLKQPLFTGSTPNQKAIIEQQGEAGFQPMPPPIAASAAPVERAPLPAPTQLASNQSSAAPVTGPFAWTAVGGRVITVAAGESVNDLSVKYGVPAAQILSANQLSSPAQVTTGRVIVIPRRVAITPETVRRDTTPAPAPAAAKPIQTAAVAAPQPRPQQPAPQQAAPAVAGSDGIYVVKAGDTLYSIARRHGANVTQLAALNNLESAAHIRIGQRLRVDGSAAPSAATSAFATAKPVPATLHKASTGPTPAPQPVKTAPVVAAPAKLPAAPAIPVETAPQTTTVAAIDSAADPASVDGTSFRWPVRGRIISGFGAKAGGERNDGINLAVPEGTSVKATEAGTVIYAGNELEGYGELILIRHADGWVSAYAHNKEIKVNRGDKVRRGQTVALAGRTGSVTTPQVHFELRRGAKPVNPLDHLTGA